MEPISMSTERLRHLLQEIRQRELDYRICSAEDVIGPGGGVYITAKSEIEARHLDWIERRNPAAEGGHLYGCAGHARRGPTGCAGRSRS